MTRTVATLALVALTTGCTGCDPRPPASGGVLDRAATHVFTSADAGFHTNTWFVDTGAEVIVVDAQFTPELAEQALAQLRTITSAPITHVIVTHPNPDKFNGAAVFQREGAELIASDATAAAMPGVHAYKRAYFEGIGMFEPGTYPAMPTVDRTFSGSLTLDLRGDGSVELIELDHPGVSSTQTIVRVNGTDLVVGDLLATDTHAWLEGGIVNGAPSPDIDSWVSALAELPALGTGRVLPGRGLPAPVASAVAEETTYLRTLDDIVADTMRSVPAGEDAQTTYGRITDAAVAAFPAYAHSYLVTYGVYGLAESYR